MLQEKIDIPARLYPPVADKKQPISREAQTRIAHEDLFAFNAKKALTALSFPPKQPVTPPNYDIFKSITSQEKKNTGM